MYVIAFFEAVLATIGGAVLLAATVLFVYWRYQRWVENREAKRYEP